MRHPRPTTVALGVGALLLLSACGGATDDAPPVGEDAEGTTSSADDSGEGGGGGAGGAGSDDDLREETELAIADASEGRDIAEEEIEVVRVEEVEWPDGSLGCPKEGEMYSQAIVPGYLVVLEVDGEELYYHGAEGEDPFHCEDPQAPTES